MLGCRHFTASYIFSHITCLFFMDRRLWYHCPSLPESTAVRHISTQTHPYSGLQCPPLLALLSRGPLFGVSLCLQRRKKESPRIWAENNVHFLLGMNMGDFTAHPELMNDVIQLDNSSFNSADQREDAKSCDMLLTVSSVTNLSLKELQSILFIKRN